MSKEIDIKDADAVEHLMSDLIRLLDILKLDNNYKPDNYHFILLLLVLQNNKCLNNIDEINFDNPDNIKKEISMSILDLDIETKEAFMELNHVYIPIVKVLKEETIYKLIHAIKSLNQAILNKYFPEIFDDFLYKVSKSQGRFAGEFLLPRELSKFVCSLIELPKKANVYNPFAGVASFGVCLDKNKKYLGQEINQTIWAIGYLRIMAHKRSAVAKFIKSDSIQDWNPTKKIRPSKPEDILLYPAEEEKFDLIISNPPYGFGKTIEINTPVRDIRSCEHFLIEKGLGSLKPNGKIIAVLSQGFLFRSGSAKELRQYLIENDLLEIVISFPSGLLLNTSIPLIVLVINKIKKEKGSVRFVDVRQFVQTISSREKKLDDYALSYFIKSSAASDSIKIVSNETIKDFDFNLSVQRYFQPSVEGAVLSELARIIRGQRSPDVKSGRFARIRDLKDDRLNYQIESKDIEEIEITRNVQQISESCLLLASRWRTLKPTYFHFAGKPIYVSLDIIALKIDESKVDIGYLINELHADYVIKQVDSFRVGHAIPYIRKEDLLSVKIKLPAYHEQRKFKESIKEQRAKISGATEALLEEKKKEEELFLKIHGIENKLIEQNAYLRHSLAGASTNLKGSIESLKRIIEEQIKPFYPQILNLKVSSTHSLDFKSYIDIIERDISKIAKTTSRVTSTFNPVEGKELYPIEIYDFLQSYVLEKLGTQNLSYKLIFTFDEEAFMDENGKIVKTYIKANKELLTDLLDNLILNAEQHAFPGFSNNRIEIYLMIHTNNYINTAVTLLFSNTGKIFPEDFSFEDYIRNGSTAGDNGGDGYGGWLINKIIKYFNGELAIINEQGPEGAPETDLATSFEINIPIIQFEDDENI